MIALTLAFIAAIVVSFFLGKYLDEKEKGYSKKRGDKK